MVILRLSLPSRNAQLTQQGRHGCSFFYVTLTSGELEPEGNTQYGSLVTIDIEQVLLATLWYGSSFSLDGLVCKDNCELIKTETLKVDYEGLG